MIRKEQLLYCDDEDYYIHVLECQRSEKVDRIILSAPLVGGSSRQQILILKPLLEPQRNNLIYSFDYSGQRISPEGTFFSIYDAIKETKAMIRFALDTSREMNIPLHLVGTCFGTISMLLALEELQWPKDVTSFTSVFGLVGLNTIIKPEEFVPFMHKHNLPITTIDEIDRFLSNYPLEDQNGLFESFVPAVCDYLSSIFPELSPIITHDHFGELVYTKTKMAQTFREFISFDEIMINPPENLPVTFNYGMRDHQIGTHTPEGEKDYREKVLRLFPHAVMNGFNVNHYNDGPESVQSSDNLYETIIAAEKDVIHNSDMECDVSMVVY